MKLLENVRGECDVCKKRSSPLMPVTLHDCWGALVGSFGVCSLNCLAKLWEDLKK